MNKHTRERSVIWIICLLSAAVSMTACTPRIPKPVAGYADSYSELMTPVSNGYVNAAGGNLLIERKDLTVDTQLGPQTVGIVWNSTTGRWTWDFNDMSYLGRTFVDDTDHTNRMEDSIPQVLGNHWRKAGTRRMKSAGGLVHKFSDEGHLEYVYWIGTDYPRLEFERDGTDPQSRVVSVTQCIDPGNCAAIYTMGYDSLGRVTSIQDLVGRTVEYTYFSDSERIKSVRDALDIEKGWPGDRYEYDASGRLTSITNSHDEQTEYVYYGVTVAVRYVRQVGENSPQIEYIYHPFDMYNYFIAQTDMIDATGGKTVFHFDSKKRIGRKIGPAGNTWRWWWSGYQQVKHVLPTGMAYLFDRIDYYTVIETTPSGNEITWVLGSNGAVNRAHPNSPAIVSVEDNLGPVLRYTYALGHLESMTTGAGDITTYTYDQDGSLTITEPGPEGVVTTYTNLGPDGHYWTASRGGTTVNYDYDPLGNLRSSDGVLPGDDPMVKPDSPGQGGVVSNGFDADRNLNLITLVDAGINAPGGQSQIAIEWRADRRPLRIRRPWGGDTKFEYSDVGRLAGKSTFVDGEWKKTHIEHDLMGRVTAVLKPNGMGKRLTYHPDGARRSIRTEKDWHDPSEWDSYAELEFLNGNLRRIRDEVHSMQPEVYIRDLHGKVREIRYPDGERFVMIRDVRGRPESEQYWSPELTQLRKFSYVYDLSNRLISVRENERELLRVEYVGNRMDRLIYGNGVDISYFYDPVTGATTGFTATNDVGEIVASSVVEHTLCSIVLPTSSCITALTTSNIGVQGVSYEEYQFEDVGSRRLIADSTGVISPLDGYYSHDELSNALKSPQGTYTYNPERNRLLEINDDFGTVMTYEYDDAGFVTRRNDIPIEWNGGGQITSVGTETEIEWDALRRKVAATIEGVTYSWRYGGRIREAADGLSTTLDLGWAVGDLINGTYVYRVYDMRGNTKLLLDDLGEVSAHYHYSGYGPEGMDGEDRTSRSFARGTEIGDLIVIGHRVYDPVAQRFLRPDPINQWINQFVYTLGDPVNTQDPTGEEFSMTVSGSIEPKVGSDGKSGWVGVKFGGKITFKWGDRGTLPEPAPPMDPAPEPIVIDGVDDDGEKGGGGTGLTGGGGGTGSPNPGSGISCGLGFEIVPLLVGWFALRSRRQSWTRSARS